MEFGLEKCAMLVMKNGKGHPMEGMELLNHNDENTRRKGNVQILGYLGS